MNFFEQQDRARRNTSKLVVLFIISVVLIVASVNAAVLGISRLLGGYHHYAREFQPVYREYRHPFLNAPQASTLEVSDFGLLAGTTCVVLLIIAGGSAYKTMSLASGGPAVAELMGGRPLAPAGSARPAEEAMLQNVVEEMSIASGVPVPRIYVMDDEKGINAFAAGFASADSVIAVTRGALTQLTRDELQGVIGHEFSHLLNGDTRLNLRLIGLLHGILVISLVGYILVRSLQFVRVSSRRDEKGGGAAVIVAIVLLGAALYAIGSIGVLFGRLIQAAVSRQREFLADASSVQFTRNPAGLVGALKKLGGYSSGSRVQNPHAMSAAHMFFGNAAGISFTQLLATHPPLEQRIRAIDPTFDGRFTPVSPAASILQQYSGAVVPLASGRQVSLGAANLTGAAGDMAPHRLAYAAGLLASIPDSLAGAAREPFGARAVVLALVLSNNPANSQKQQAIIQQNVEPACFEQVRRLSGPVGQLGEGARLPLLDLALPALQQLSPPQAARFLATVRAVIQADGKITLFEYAVNRLLEKRLAPPDQSRREPIQFFAVNAIREEAAVVLWALAEFSTARTEEAFAAGSQQLDPAGLLETPAAEGLAAVDAALRKLARSSPAVKKRLMDAASATIVADNQINVAEAELLRAIAATLDVPVPPMLAAGE